ncbi:hypothetical protein APX81_10845 [Escherichia coli]|uniref:DNA replication protein n=2 Tax=Escherichia coli TaxID=562 RepID=A0A075MEP2_ECOLX|nr:hypothetical protein [Escherichia coli]OYG83140.1 hypothetical protein CI731_11485 [Shigella sonnei]PLN34213.1 hypothetical protein CWM91_04320 [Klebsiella pneumoniae]CDL51314.1 hypothetical protein [Klebsiella pneumoniae ISC21]AIF77616.1 hypothetical protein [Escherichia coli]AIF78259.1 hypothetical protein [Escherichia coli]
MGSCAAPSAKGDDKFITTDYLQQCRYNKNIINKIECCSVDNLQSLLSIIAAKMKSMIYQK